MASKKNWLVLLAALLLLNVYQMYTSGVKSKKIEELTKHDITVRYQPLDDLQRSGHRINWELNPNAPVTLFAFIPVNSCDAFINYDSRVITGLNLHSKPSFKVVVLSENGVFSNQLFEALDVDVEYISDFSSVLNSTDFTVPSSPFYLLVNSTGNILSSHTSSLYFPEQTKYYLKNVSGLL